MKDFVRSLRAGICLVISAGLTSTLFTEIIDARERHRNELMDRRLVTLRIAADLDAFSEHCADLVADYEALSPPRRAQMTWHLPKLANWPDDDRARLLPTETASHLWEMHLKRRVAEEYIASAVHYATSSDVAEATRDEAILLSAAAWKLSTEMREEQGYPRIRLGEAFGKELTDAVPAVFERWKSVHGPGGFPE